MIVENNRSTKAKKKNEKRYPAVNFRSSPEIIYGITNQLIGMMSDRGIDFYGRKPNKEAMYNSIVLAIHDVETGGEFDWEAASRVGLLEALYEHGKPLLARRMREKPEEWPKTYSKHVNANPPRKLKPIRTTVQLSESDQRKLDHLAAKYPHFADHIARAIESNKTPKEIKALPKPDPKPSIIPDNAISRNSGHAAGRAKGKKKATE